MKPICLILIILLTQSSVAQLPSIESLEALQEQYEREAKMPVAFEKELVLVGLLNQLPLGNAKQINGGTFASFYESQEEQFRVSMNLLTDILQKTDASATPIWKLQENKGKTIYSVKGIKVIDRWLKHTEASGTFREINGLLVEFIVNYFDFCSDIFIGSTPKQHRDHKLSLLAGFLLREQNGDKIEASNSEFTQQMLRWMLLEGCVFNSYRINNAIPETVHLHFEAPDSLAEVFAYVESERKRALTPE